MTTVGADVEALRQLAQMFTDNLVEADRRCNSNDQLAAKFQAAGSGEDAESFKADWHGHLMASSTTQRPSFPTPPPR